jgi:hypothetical protein
MTVTLLASYLVASRTERFREAGFWWFLASNVLWVVWGLFDGAYALVVLQIGLAAINIRGVRKNEAA